MKIMKTKYPQIYGEPEHKKVKQTKSKPPTSKPVETPKQQPKKYFQLAQEYISMSDQNTLNKMYAGKSEQQKKNISNDLIRKLNDIAKEMKESEQTKVANMTKEEKEIHKSMQKSFKGLSLRMLNVTKPEFNK